MAGLYIHIPFCKHKCHYCNFYSLASVKYREEIIGAILRETELRKDYLKGEKLKTVYFGGGTPSLFPPPLLPLPPQAVKPKAAAIDADKNNLLSISVFILRE